MKPFYHVLCTIHVLAFALLTLFSLIFGEFPVLIYSMSMILWFAKILRGFKNMEFKINLESV